MKQLRYYYFEYLSSILLNQKEKIVPNINITMEKMIAIGKLKPEFANPSVVNEGNTVVGKIATDDPTTIPKIKWYIFE